MRPIYTSLFTDMKSKETYLNEKRRIKVPYIPEHRIMHQGFEASVDAHFTQDLFTRLFSLTQIEKRPIYMKIDL